MSVRQARNLALAVTFVCIASFFIVTVGLVGGLYPVILSSTSRPGAIQSPVKALAHMFNLTFVPANFTVVMGVNNTVLWTNNDTAPHTVTATDGSWDSGNMNEGATYIHTFTAPGSYPYFCKYHAWMHGTVKVLASSGG